MRVQLLITVCIMGLTLTACEIKDKEDNTGISAEHTDSFVKLESVENYEYTSENISDIEEFTEEVKDIEAVPGISYSDYLYEISDNQSDNIDIESVEAIEFEHDLSMIDEVEIKNLIKAIYIEENATNIEIGDYYDDYINGDYCVTCAVKIDDYWYIITSIDGVASSIKDVYGAYEYQPEE